MLVHVAHARGFRARKHGCPFPLSGERGETDPAPLRLRARERFVCSGPRRRERGEAAINNATHHQYLGRITAEAGARIYTRARSRTIRSTRPSVTGFSRGAQVDS